MTSRPVSRPTSQFPTAGRPRRPARSRALGVVPGLVVCVAIACAATVLGRLAPVVGAPVIAILIGVVWRVVGGLRPVLTAGVRTSSGPVLQLAAVVLGSQLSLAQIADVGLGSLPVMLGTFVLCLTVAWLVGRRLGIEADLRTLIGVGTAICGASAIAAVSPVIRARSATIAYALSTIFLFNVAAVLVFPPLGHLLGMSQGSFGLFAGTAVNDTSSVVATASVYGHVAAVHAVVVKLVRTLLIIPVSLTLAVLVRRRDRRQGAAVAAGPTRAIRLVPWFLVGFVAVAGLNSAGAIPASSHGTLALVALFLITVALAGIGLSTNLAELRRTGPRPLLLGLLLWITVAAASLLLQWATV